MVHEESTFGIGRRGNAWPDATIAAPAPAHAWRGGILPGRGWRIIAGAVIGGIASSAYAYGPGYGYYDGYAPGMVMAVDTPRPTMAAITASYYGGPYSSRISSVVRLLSASSVYGYGYWNRLIGRW